MGIKDIYISRFQINPLQEILLMSELQTLLLGILGKSTESKSTRELQKYLFEQMGAQHRVRLLRRNLHSLKRAGLVELDTEEAQRNGHRSTCFWLIKKVK